MEQPQTKLVAELFDESEMADLVEAALEGRVALVPLRRWPRDHGGHALYLQAPGVAGEVVLLGSLAGDPTDGIYPLHLQPVREEDVGELEAFLSAVRASWAPRQRSMVRSSQVPDVPLSGPVPTEEARLSAPPDDLLGRTLGGNRYRILSLIGAGGMGRVYEALHVALDKKIAVKVLQATRQHDPEFSSRFQQEALAASKLDHPNAMHVLDFGEEPDGLSYIAMELLTGRSLSAALEEAGRIPVERAVEVVGQVCSALAAAHDMGIVHRDVKPENVMLVPRKNDEGVTVESVKVCDFGLAKISQATAGARHRPSVDGGVKGTPEYMSPEQARGEEIDLRTDVYACGVILYELVTGTVPFSADTPVGILTKHVTDAPLPPSRLVPDLPPAVEGIILRALEKDRARRPQTARELRDSLRAALDESRVQSGPAWYELAAPPPTVRGSGVRIVEAPPPAQPPPEPPSPQHVAVGPMRHPTPPPLSVRGAMMTPGTPRNATPPVPPTVPLSSTSGLHPAAQPPASTGLGASAVTAGGVPHPAVPQSTRGTPPSTGGPDPDAPIVEQRAEALAQSPETVLRALYGLTERGAYLRESQLLEKALRQLVREARLDVVWATRSLFLKIARGAQPGEGSREALAARAVHGLAEPDLLRAVGEVLIAGKPAQRDPARALLAAAGAAGAEALCSARLGAAAASRPRFVAALKDLGETAVPAITAALAALAPSGDAATLDVAEDLLRAVPPVADRDLGKEIARFAESVSPPIRRAAIAPLAQAWGERAKDVLTAALSDHDDAVKVSAIGGLRRLGMVGREVVDAVAAHVGPRSTAPEELRAAALAALADVQPDARAAAYSVLVHALEPRSHTLVGMLRGGSTESVLVLETAATVMLKIGGAEGRRLVENRANMSKGEVRDRLRAMLKG